MKEHSMSKRHVAAVAATIGTLAAVPFAASAGNGSGGTQTYRVTIENISTGSQPFSPAGVVVHDRRADVWSVGAPASAAVAAIAEDADLAIFVETYSGVAGVRSSVASPGPFGPGTEVSFEVEGRRNDRLSLVSMLVNTNDAFTGLDSVRLGNRPVELEVGAYDAGTEVNNELASHIPGPVGGNAFVRDPEGGVVTSHPGIVGQPGGIDPGTYDWDDPVARITIEPLG
jgi:hypothetical protein